VFACPVYGSTLEFPALVVFEDTGRFSLLPFELSPGTMTGDRAVVVGAGAGLGFKDISGG